MYTNWRIQVIPYDEGKGDWVLGDAEEIGRFSRPLFTIREGDNRNSFDLTFKELGVSKVSKLRMNDMLLIFRSVNTDSITEENLLMNGIIGSSTVDKKEDSDEIKVEGYDFSDSVARAITFVDAQNLTIPQAFRRAIQFTKEQAKSFRLTWHPSNPELNSEGQPFPIVGERIFYKPMRFLFTQWSANDRTGDGNYYWFITPTRHLVWRKRTEDVDDSFDSTTDSFVSMKTGVDKEGVINYVIVKGGIDPAGSPVEMPYWDSVSVARHGQRFKLIPSIAKTAQTYNDADMKSLGIEDSRFPREEDYSFTTTWKSLAKDPPDFVTVANDTEYVRAIQDHMKVVMSKEAERVVKNHLWGKFELQVGFKPGQKNWVIGTVVECTVPGLFEPDVPVSKKLRVEKIQYSDTVDTYTLREDIGSV